MLINAVPETLILLPWLTALVFKLRLFDKAEFMVKLEEQEFVSRLNAALLDRTGESGWVTTLAGSLDLIISALAGPTKQSTVKPPVIAGTVGYRLAFQAASHCRYSRVQAILSSR